MADDVARQATAEQGAGVVVEAHMIVMKFGGTSVGDPERIAHVASLVVRHDGPVVVVTSAMGGTTDTLLQAGRDAEAGRVDAALAAVDGLRARHEAVTKDLATRARLSLLFDGLRDLLRGVGLLREQTARSRALLASFGERLAAPIVAQAIRQAGRGSEDVDARDVVVTNDRYEEAAVLDDLSRARVRSLLLPMVGVDTVPVVTGFIGATAQGTTTLLGRGGSDYSAALFGAWLDADAVWIWTDVDGILSADPRVVPDARPLERVGWREAAEMSYFGAKVVHPKTMLPVMGPGIPLVIRSTFHPDRPGTIIGPETSTAPFGVKTVTATRGQALVTIEGRGLAGLRGAARRILGAAEAARVNVVMISQASSEQAVTLVVPASGADAIVDALTEAFELEMDRGLVEPPKVQTGVAVLSAVGEGMAGVPGTSARLFEALGRTGVNVLAIAQGASERSISAAITESDAVRAIRSVHAAFGLTHSVDLVLLGHGRVAQALLPMIAETRDELRRNRGLDLRILAAATSRQWAMVPEGLDPEEVAEALARGERRPEDAVLLDAVEAVRHGPVVLVDVTASDTASLHQQALDRGFHVVTANKVPLTGDMATYARMVQAVRRTGARYGYETTFGAGLPVLHALKELLTTGDRIDAVEGALSGTLGFLVTRLQDGYGLAQAVQEAADAGFTEPDPREDLSGRDVARKALIIGRAVGLPLEPEDVLCEPVIDDLERGLDAAIALHAPALEARVREAAARGGVLRYVATIRPDKVTVGLRELPVSDPLGQLRGPDNLIVFRTARYKEYPLVVRGPGAGAAVTAAGVLGDVIRVASGER